MKLSELFWKCHTIDYDTVGNDVNYKFIEEGSTLYIYFQGSSSVTDWVRNFLFVKKPYKGMEIPYYVHGGFLKAWKEVEDIIINKIKQTYKVKYNDVNFDTYKYNKIIIVGYSHGAALSGLCHECVWFHRKDLRETGLEGYGFESPRFFSSYYIPKEIAIRWNNYIVIRNYNDIVTYSPPWLFKYHHVGKLLKIKRDDHIGLIKAHYSEEVRDSLIFYETKNIINNKNLK